MAITRRDFFVLSASAMAATGAGLALWPFLASMKPSDDVLAKMTTWVDLTKIPVGKTRRVRWKRDIPVDIRHRTPEEIELARHADIKELRNPVDDSTRVKPGKEEWLIVLPICTHEPFIVHNDHDKGRGWICYCCGAIYDLAGRLLYHSPARKNLEIPPYRFESDTQLVIGYS